MLLAGPAVQPWPEEPQETSPLTKLRLMETGTPSHQPGLLRPHPPRTPTSLPLEPHGVAATGLAGGTVAPGAVAGVGGGAVLAGIGAGAAAAGAGDSAGVGAGEAGV